MCRKEGEGGGLMRCGGKVDWCVRDGFYERVLRPVQSLLSVCSRW